jgi:hypothetical protein
VTKITEKKVLIKTQALDLSIRKLEPLYSSRKKKKKKKPWKLLSFVMKASSATCVLLNLPLGWWL